MGVYWVGSSSTLYRESSHHIEVCYMGVSRGLNYLTQAILNIWSLRNCIDFGMMELGIISLKERATKNVQKKKKKRRSGTGTGQRVVHLPAERAEAVCRLARRLVTRLIPARRARWILGGSTRRRIYIESECSHTIPQTTVTLDQAWFTSNAAFWVCTVSWTWMTKAWNMDSLSSEYYFDNSKPWFYFQLCKFFSSGWSSKLANGRLVLKHILLQYNLLFNRLCSLIGEIVIMNKSVNVEVW